MNKILLIILASIFTVGCAPLYKPEDINKTVSIVPSPDTTSSLRICKRGEWYRLGTQSDGNIRVPYGQRISIANFYFRIEDDGMFEHEISCSPSTSFIPVKGNKYYVNFLIQKKTCVIEVLRYSATNKTGLAPEPSAGEGDTCLS